MINVQDIVDKRIGKLVVKEYAYSYRDCTAGGERMRHKYLVRCDCGVTKYMQRGPLVSGVVYSCGCERRTKYGH